MVPEHPADHLGLPEREMRELQNADFGALRAGGNADRFLFPRELVVFRAPVGCARTGGLHHSRWVHRGDIH